MNLATARWTSTLLLGAVLVAGCDQNNSEPAAPTEAAEVVATVNGADVTQSDLDAYLQGLQAAQPGVVADPGTALNDLVRLKLIAQEAEQQGIDKRPEIQAELGWQRTNLLVNTLMQERMSDMTFSDKDLKAEYEKQLAQLSNREYKARHILTATQEEAQAVIKQLDGGADFATLSEQESTDSSAPQGGDLGWFSPEAMVPPFAQAIKQLEKGTYTKQPVPTQFGWHVILLEDTRELEPPTYAEVEERLSGILSNRALQDYIKSLRDEAQVNIKLKTQAQDSGS
ncbi:MAG: peptidylprolyl isomerase [Gammaproteobacteria bacterium]|nr:peptidylprolyl isomerase [Gammaproteobacteria bacterium]MBA3731517.1 peptidylprolyl isomerase [Gammaproteobacteria bacterium]